MFVERRLDQAPHITAQGSFDRREQQQVIAGNQRFLTEQTTLGLDAAWAGPVRPSAACIGGRACRPGCRAGQPTGRAGHRCCRSGAQLFRTARYQKRLDVSKRTLTNLRDTRS
ncbi:hypothetical protein [Xanthomonas citri]|uniref:hypothetical protein n=1 Tax=Xanthomonas citri TaxID=346 RepID=UPI000B0A4342|nr:hypothetical protein [Xanthomonas citri]